MGHGKCTGWRAEPAVNYEQEEGLGLKVCPCILAEGKREEDVRNGN